MAVDKKRDYHNPPQHYHDLDGNLKNFTYIDMDKKIKLPPPGPLDEEEVQMLNQSMEQYRKSLVDDILSISASACPPIFEDFVVRDGKTINWNDTMLKDEGIPVGRLRDILTLTQKRINLNW